MHVSDSTDHIISHDPATHQVKTKTPPSQHKKVASLLVLFGVLLVVVGAAWYFNGQSFDFSNDRDSDFSLETIDETVIATVGVENIYAEDLNAKLRTFPEEEQKALRENFKNQLIEESIILQAGADLGYIELSSEVFNSLTKNQNSRSLLVEQVRDQVSKNAANIQGAYVSIWFMNYKPGPIGYEAGKELAFNKISVLHDAVISGQMTIEQAGKAIRDDSELANVDEQYKTNAYVEFDSKDNVGGLTFLPEFDEELLALEPGETTDIFLGQDYQEANFDLPKRDAIYLFGQVTSKTEGSEPFDVWLSTQKENYEVIEL